MITTVVGVCEALFETIPLSMMQIWGRFGYMVGLCLMAAAYLGFTFRPGGAGASAESGWAGTARPS